MRFRTLAAALAATATAAACSDTPPTAAPEFPADIQAAIAAGYQSLTITPAVDTVEVGKSITLTVKFPGGSGDQKDAPKVNWGSNDPSVASVGGGKITGRKPGKISVVALSSNAFGFATVVVRKASKVDESERPDSTGAAGPGTDSSATSDSVATPDPVPGGSSLGALASGYSASSPHWSHIRTLTTDFYYDWTPTERAWAGQHYDAALSGNSDAWHAANPTVTQLPYTLVWSLILPGENNQPFLSSTYYADMKAWYAAHTQYRIEDAFLHTSSSKSEGTRVKVHVWESWRWLINPSDPGARAYTVDRYRRLAQGRSGLFVDEASSGDIIPRAKLGVEFEAARYEADYTSLLAAIKRELGSKTLMLNTAEYTKSFDRANAAAAGAVHLELFNNPMLSQIALRWNWVEELLAAGVWVNMESPYARSWADEHASQYPKGNYATSGDRMQMWELASYYMVVGKNPDKLSFHLKAPTYQTAPSKYWLPAIEANIGHPVSARSERVQGTDPTGQVYTVYQRDFDRALVLIRAQRGWDTQNYKDATAVNVSLPSGESWLPLHADGTLGASVTSVKLRNSEAVILVKKSKL